MECVVFCCEVFCTVLLVVCRYVCGMCGCGVKGECLTFYLEYMFNVEYVCCLKAICGNYLGECGVLRCVLCVWYLET